MADDAKAVLEHAPEAIKLLSVLAAAFASMLAWFAKRTLGRMEKQQDDQAEYLDEIDRKLDGINNRLTIIETEHQLRHRGEPLPRRD